MCDKNVIAKDAGASTMEKNWRSIPDPRVEPDMTDALWENLPGRFVKDSDSNGISENTVISRHYETLR